MFLPASVRLGQKRMPEGVLTLSEILGWHQTLMIGAQHLCICSSLGKHMVLEAPMGLVSSRGKLGSPKHSVMLKLALC